MFFHQLFRVPRTTPSVSFYLETGSLTFGMLIKMRRLKYLHYLINLPRPDMLQKVFIEQWRNPSKNDWTTVVQKDMVEFDLGQDWTKIKGVSYKVFAAGIDEMGRKLEFLRLREIKKSKSKLSSIKYNKFEPQEYLNIKNISLDQVLAIFSFRTRMVPCDMTVSI